VSVRDLNDDDDGERRLFQGLHLYEFVKGVRNNWNGWLLPLSRALMLYQLLYAIFICYRQMAPLLSSRGTVWLLQTNKFQFR